MTSAQLLEKYRRALPNPDHQFADIALAFLEWLGDRPPTMANAHGWMRHQKARGRKSGTLRKEWGVLQRLYTVNGLAWEVKRGEAPAANEEDAWHPLLDPDVIMAMIRVSRGLIENHSDISPAPVHRCFLCLSTIWGLRRVEMSVMDPSFLDLKGQLVHVLTAKGGRARWHWIPPEIMPYLSEWGFVTRISVSQLSEVFVELRAMAGVEPGQSLGWHSIRRSLAHHLLSSGLDEATVRRFLRWKSTGDMLMRYATAPMVGFSGKTRVLGVDDKKADMRVLERHPFLEYWR